MIETNIKDLSVEEIMKKIQEEVKKKDNNSLLKNKSMMQTIFPKNDNSFSIKEVYEYNDFTKYHDVEFVQNLYKGLLKREADKEGLEYYLNLLRSGEKSKNEIISLFRYSKEGKNKNVQLLGSKKRYIQAYLYKLPIVGYILKSIYTILTLPKLLKRLNALENYVTQVDIKSKKNDLLLEKAINQKAQELQSNIDTKAQELQSNIDTKAQELQSNIDTKAQELQSNIDTKAQELQSNIDTKAQELQSNIDTKAQELQSNIDTKAQELQSNIDTKAQELQSNIDTKAQELQSNIDTKANIDDIQFYLQSVNYVKEYMKISQQNIQNLIEEAKKRLPNDTFEKKELIALTEEEKHKFDTFYVEFEDRFRGTREEIKQRVKVYLPYIEKLPFNKEELKALDVGCGRGEWLELLNDNGYNAQGIDLNRIMVAKSQELGLDVKEADVIEYLSSLEDESLSVITGFHIIEHLPFEVLMKMLEESYRVLKKGGMAIFETLNPENLVVGACNFYTDPTHLNPLVPESTEFIFQSVGFNTQIKRLNLMKEVKYIDDKKFSDLNNLLYAVSKEQDYAVIGYK